MPVFIAIIMGAAALAVAFSVCVHHALCKREREWASAVIIVTTATSRADLTASKLAKFA